MSQNIEEKLEKIVSNRNIYRTGKVTRINSFVVETTGLDDVFYFEKVFIGSEDNIGYVDKIESNKVYISVVKEDRPIHIGDNVISTKEPLTSYFSEECMGMVIDMFGNDKLSGKPFNNSRSIMIETPKIGIMDRTAVNRPLETGIAAIDMLYPIGRGQRQLIIGDKKIGKTQIALDTIVNQKDKDMICIYVAIGKTKKEIKSVYTKLIEKGANAYTIIVSAFNDDPVPVLKLTPYVGVSMAEEFLKQGKDVLVVIDDLKKHADACREISLIANKNTGRDAYPADIFYTHSRLLEKGCQHKNGGSITILPIIETKGNDITDYISTNVISITDGQIVLSPKLFEKGQKPAINFGLSVSRLGSAVQRQEIVDVGSTIRKTLLSYLETAEVYELVNEETMTPELKHQLRVGKKILQLLKQPKFTPLSASELASRFEFIYMHDEEEGTKPSDVEENLINNDNNSDVEEIIPMPAGLDNMLDSENSTMEEFKIEEGPVTFEELPTNTESSYNLVSPTDNMVENNPEVVVAPTTEEIVEPPVIVEAPIVEAPVIEPPIVDTPIVDAPVTEETPVIVESPVVEEPSIESELPIEEPVIEGTSIEQEVQTVEPPVVESPAIEEPIIEEFAPEEPVIETESIVEEPSIEPEPSIEEPVIEGTSIEQEVQTVEPPVVESPAIEEPIIEEFAPEEPVIETESIVEEPSIETELPIEEPVIEDSPIELEVTSEEEPTELPVEETQEELPELEQTTEEAPEDNNLWSEVETNEEVEIPVEEDVELPTDIVIETEDDDFDLPKAEPEKKIVLPNDFFDEKDDVQTSPISIIEENNEIELPNQIEFEFDDEEIEVPTLKKTLPVEDTEDDDIELPAVATEEVNLPRAVDIEDEEDIEMPSLKDE